MTTIASLDIARHLRIIRAELDDDFVEKRMKAIASLAARLRERKAADSILGLSGSVVAMFATDAFDVEDALHGEAAAEIASHAPAFVADETTRLEVTVCFILGCGDALEPEPAETDAFRALLFARSLRSGLDSLPPHPQARVEDLRRAVQQIASARVESEGHAARRRGPVVVEKLPEPTDDEQPPAYAKRLAGVATKLSASLARNAELDREELDLLWWVLSGRSELLGGPASLAEPRAAAVAVGVEMSGLLRRTPVEAHAQLTARNLPHAEPGYVLRDFFSVAPEVAKKVIAQLGPAMKFVREQPGLFPLLWAMDATAASPPTSADRGGPTFALALDGEQRPLDYWARRAFYEASLARATVSKPWAG